ncbi:ATP synthase delta chain, chloroplastic-like [Salvia splendens]|uniref:ATP synthase delta chain, chloroplastic-like n=1 Tax=Salvia splendens TaxID=180675 RepID=UPI001C27C5FC|nr:ATP synthase delta chain, chloroplastic-like [Salvia splendens]
MSEAMETLNWNSIKIARKKQYIIQFRDPPFNLADEISRSLGLQPHVANFVNILVDMKRVDLIKEIAAEFKLIANRLSETEVATVASVVELEPQHLAEIAKRVQKLTGAKNVKLKTVIDKSLLAGITIRYGNFSSKLIDLSVKKQLDDVPGL